MYNALKNIHTTLNTIPVSGRESIARMLGCMQLLETILGKMENLDSTDHIERKETDDDSDRTGTDTPGGLDVAGGGQR